MQISAPLNSEPTPCLQQIEVATFFQLPSFQIIGLPSPEVAEARERVRAAIEASAQEFPRRRVVLNLSPASIRKRGTGLDLAMALAVLAVGIKQKFTLGAWGELGLDGAVKPVGQLTRSLFAAWSGGLKYLILSREEFPMALQVLENIRESGEIGGEPPILVPVHSLAEAWKRIEDGERALARGEHSSSSKAPIQSSPQPVLQRLGPEEPLGKLEIKSSYLLPLSPSLERVIGVAAAGHHHILLLGPKGTGKSHAIEWLIALKPPLSPQERLRHDLIVELENATGRPSLEMGAARQLVGRGDQQEEGQQEIESHSVRRVSSQVRPGALVGSASSTRIRPGVFSLTHGGLLIADEFPEWHRDSREALREPLERQKITLTRAQGRIELPARFQLGASGNLCPCGGWPIQFPFPMDLVGDKKQLRCKCTDTARKTYISRLSGPILDRIDLVVLISQAPKLDKIPSSSAVQLEVLKKKVFETKEKFNRLFGKPPGNLSGAETESLIQSNPRFARLLEQSGYSSLRSRHKMVRMAYSFSIWDGLDEPLASHLSEASCYRSERYASMMD